MTEVKIRYFRTSADSEHNRFTQYRVVVQADGIDLKEDQVVWRRFSEFEELLKVLQKAGFKSELKNVSLPSKWFSTAPRYRMVELEKMLTKIVNNTAVDGKLDTAPRELLVFLGVDKFIKSAAPQQVAKYVPHEPIPEEYREALEKCVDELAEIDKLVSSNDPALRKNAGWKELGQSGPISWHAHADKDQRMVYGTIAQSTPRMIHDIFNSVPDFKVLEPAINTVQDLQKFGHQTEIQYAVMHSIMWLPPRDCILVRHWRVLPNGTIYHVDITVDNYPGVPEMDTLGRVRAVQKFGGTIIRPIPGEATRTFVLMVNDMDPRVTGVPASVQSKVNEFSASMLSNNLLALIKLVKKKDLRAYLAAAPVQNGGQADQQELLALSASTSDASDEDPSPLTKNMLLVLFALVVCIGGILVQHYLSTKYIT